MASQFTLPALGESIESGTLVKFLVAPGDTIEEDQPVLELETDKAVVEVPSNVAGTVGELVAKPGQKLKVGDAVFEMAGSSAAAPETKADAKPEAAPATAAVASNGNANGAVSSGGNVNGANGLGNAGGNAAAARTPQENEDSIRSKTPAPTNPASSSVAAAPSVRRMARELGIDIAQLSGSGSHGRITYSDVRNALQRNAGSGAPSGISIPPLPDFSKWGETEAQPMSGVRLATAKHMARCWAEIPHVTQFDKADTTDLEKLRKQFGAQVEKAGAKLTPTAILLKVVASALKKFPQFNSSLDLANETIVLKKFINIGVAVDTPRGLLVPVIRDVDKKNIIELSIELAQLSETARNGKTSLADMQGGTFTITNLGGIGGTAFTPIVNAPEVAILGVARGTNEPVWNGSAFEPRMMMPLCLSYDHRVIDGANGARFLRWVATALEQPFMLSLEG
ncbi:MAG TPA: 2-oxo acid dehydrogenase subunit E2 [Abditibacteriaceae bacterium]